MKVEKRDYQQEALKTLKQTRKKKTNKALLHMATGLGKSYIAMQDILQVNPKKVLFTANMQDVLIEAREEAQRQKIAHKIDFKTLQWLYANLDTIHPKEYDYIVYDEAHHMQANTYRQVAKKLEPKFTLALTATPDRHDGKKISDLFGKPIYTKTLPEALAQGWLAQVEYHLLFDDATLEAINEGFTNKTAKQLKNLLAVNPRNEQIVESIKKEKRKLKLEHAPTVIFCQNITHAKQIAKLTGGHPYHSQISDPKRELLFNRFKNGQIETLCVVDTFNEGVNIPEAQCLIFLRSTSSHTIYFQQLGRGLRKTATKKKVVVLDFAANVERLKHIYTLASNIIEEEKLLGISSDKTSDSNGIRFNFQGGSFDFSVEVIDILDHLNFISSEILEGELYVFELEKKYGLYPGSLVTRIKATGVPYKRRKWGRIVIEAQDWQKFVSKHPYIVRQEEPYVALMDIEKKHGVSVKSTTGCLGEREIFKRLHKVGLNRKVVNCISEEDYLFLQREYPVLYGDLGGTKFFSAKELQEKFNVTERAFHRVRDKIGVIPVRGRPSSQEGKGPPCDVYDEHQVGLILGELEKRVRPELKACSVEGCETRTKAKDLCSKHYSRQLRQKKLNRERIGEI